MKKPITVFLILISLFITCYPVLATHDGDIIDINIISNEKWDEIQLESQGALLMALDNSDILFSKDADSRLYPASTTKILTALLALENGDLEEIVVVGNEANLCGYNSSLAGLDIGEEITLRNLLYGLMLRSGNDAAYVVAVHIGRKFKSEPDLPINEALETFIDLMNSRSRELGATNSNFITPDGYHHSDHYTTAYDMALIAQEAMKNDIFRKIVRTEMVTILDWSSLHDPKAKEKEIRYWKNTNALIHPKDKFYYPDAIGIKTGYTDNSKHCLIAAASRNGTEFLVVILGSSTKDSKWTDATTLLDYGFDNFIKYGPFNQGEQIEILDVINNPVSNQVEVLIDKASAYYVPKDRLSEIQHEIKWDSQVIQEIEDGINKLSLPAPIAKHQKVGTMIIKLGSRTLDKIDLLASRAIDSKKSKTPNSPSKFPKDINNSHLLLWWNSFNLWQKMGIGIAGLMLFLLTLRFRASRRRRKYIFRRRY